MSGGAGPRRVGSEWERRVRDHFRARGFDAERAYGAGRADDVGDLVVGAWVALLVECKAAARSERARWIDEAREKVSRWRSGAIPLVVEKRRRKPVGSAYVTLDLDGFLDLIDRIAHKIADLDERDLSA